MCFVVLYAAGALGYKVGGSHISLEAKAHTLEQEKEELKTASTALPKSLYIVLMSGGALSVMLKSNKKLIDQYLSDASNIIDIEAKSVVDRDLDALRNAKSNS